MRANDLTLGNSESVETKQIVSALAKAQMEFPSIVEDAKNSHLGNTYATFQQCSAALRTPLTKHGLALPQYQTCLTRDVGWVCIGTLRHESGEYISGMVPILNHPVRRKDRRTEEVVEEPPSMQGFGACLTYAKRQLLLSLTGAWVGEVDDDGHGEQEVAAPAVGLPDPPKDSPSAMEANYTNIMSQKIRDAASAAEAKRVLDTVKLRVREKKVNRVVLTQCTESFNEKWGGQS